MAPCPQLLLIKCVGGSGARAGAATGLVLALRTRPSPAAWGKGLGVPGWLCPTGQHWWLGRAPWARGSVTVTGQRGGEGRLFVIEAGGRAAQRPRV